MEPAETTIPEATETAFVYPPKYEKAATRDNLWIKSVSSLLLYLLAGYFFFPDYKSLFLITVIIMIHEMGHFLAMKAFGYSDVGIFFIPLLGAYVSGAKREVSQLQSAIILLAGPLPGIIAGIILILIHQNNPVEIAGISFYQAGIIFLILNLLNLLPIYPLDGGQLLNRVFLDEESLGSKIFVIVSAALMCWFVWFMYNRSHNPSIFILLFFPVSMLLRRLGENKLSVIEKKVEEAGIHTDIDYADLPDKDYWQIRNIAIENMAEFKNIETAPPYEYCSKEEKIMETVQSLLHRHLLQDVSIIGKIVILLLWVVALASPWLLSINTGFFGKSGL